MLCFIIWNVKTFIIQIYVKEWYIDHIVKELCYYDVVSIPAKLLVIIFDAGECS